MMSRTIDLELTRAEVEVRELEARLRVVPMNDNQLSDALRTALAAKKERLEKLKALHAAGSKPKPQRPQFDGADPNGDGDNSPSRKIPVHAGHRTPLKRTIPQRAKPSPTPAKPKTRK
jgi:hypothetical protein